MPVILGRSKGIPFSSHETTRHDAALGRDQRRTNPATGVDRSPIRSQIRYRRNGTPVSALNRCVPQVRCVHAEAAFVVRAGIVIAATPMTTQASPIQAVGDRRSPRNNTPIATPIGTLK